MIHYHRRPSGLYVPQEARSFRGGVGFGGSAGRSGTSVFVAPTQAITSIDPSTGGTGGGGTLTAWGTGFQSGDVIRVDAVNQTTTFVDSGKLTCTIPAHAAGAVNVVVRRGVSDSNTATFEYVAGGGVPTDMVFRTPWATSTGTTDAARRDTAQAVPWTTTNTRLNEVLAATGLDFPSTNVYKAIAQWSGNPAQVNFTDILTLGNPNASPPTGPLSVPAIGESLYYRWYQRVLVANALDSTTATPHPMDVGPGAAQHNHSYEFDVLQNGTWRPGFKVQNAYPNNRWYSTTYLNKNQTYRLELHVHRVDATTFNLHVRVYDSSNVLLLTDGYFRNQRGSGSLTLASTPAFTIDNEDYWKTWKCGNNGPAWNNIVEGDHPYDMWCFGGVAVRTDDWCGAFNILEETP